MFRRILLLATLALYLVAPVACADSLPPKLAAVIARTLAGQETNLLHSPGKAVVFIFVSVDCPISNRYAPEIGRLDEEFSAKGISFKLIYPVSDQTAADIREHLREYRLSLPAFRDPEQNAVRAADARVTPEAAVFVPGNGWVYRGRIDNRYVDFGQKRPAATRHDLREILLAVLEGKPVTARTTRAIGCAIPSL